MSGIPPSIYLRRVDYGVRGNSGDMTPNVVFPPLEEVDAFIAAVQVSAVAIAWPHTH
jgi:hypothetical protein